MFSGSHWRPVWRWRHHARAKWPPFIPAAEIPVRQSHICSPREWGIRCLLQQRILYILSQSRLHGLPSGRRETIAQRWWTHHRDDASELWYLLFLFQEIEEKFEPYRNRKGEKWCIRKSRFEGKQVWNYYGVPKMTPSKFVYFHQLENYYHVSHTKFIEVSVFK